MRAIHNLCAVAVWGILVISTGCDFQGTIIHLDSTDISPGDAIANDTVGSDSTDSATDTHSDTLFENETASDTETDSTSDTLIENDTDNSSDTAYDSDSDSLSHTDASWTFFTIADMQDGPENGINHIRSMYALDPNAVALFEVGDLTHNALESEWEAHHRALQTGALDAGGADSHFNPFVTDWGPYTRFIGIQGNHDTYSGNWYSYWNQFLPGQQLLGENSASGIYFTLDYTNTLFIILDSNHFSDTQTNWLESVLHSQFAKNARWKIAFFHEPVYPCNSKSPKYMALPWVALFEEAGVDLAVHGHAHTFEQTCPMKHGSCVSNEEHGVTYLTASGGGTSYLRTVDPTDSGTLTYGNRTDTYQCSEILVDYESTWNHFCHYAVSNCRLVVRCYDHDYWAGGELRHQFTLEKCPLETVHLK